MTQIKIELTVPSFDEVIFFLKDWFDTKPVNAIQ